MVRARGTHKSGAAAPATTPDDTAGMDVNAVVSYNLRAIRERRAMTQQGVAESLAQLTGHLLPQASISGMERGFDGERRRRFDAHELYLLSVVFDVPIAYFFLPPPGTGLEVLADTGRPVAELYASLLGHEHQLDELDQRLASLNVEDPALVDDVFARLSGASDTDTNWHEHFRTWRQKRLDELATNYGDQLDEIAAGLAEFAHQIQQAGPLAYLQWKAHKDGDGRTSPPQRAR
jgi:transcriptional regulator with XRE-family HTH domain